MMEGAGAGSERRRHRCELCGKRFKQRAHLDRHLRVHVHIEPVHVSLQTHKPDTCEVCGKTFSKKGHLDRHRRTIHQEYIVSF